MPQDVKKEKNRRNMTTTSCTATAEEDTAFAWTCIEKIGVEGVRTYVETSSL